MNYSNIFVSALGMAPTYILGGILMFTLPLIAWICGMLILIFGSAYVYSISVEKAARAQKKPMLIYAALFFSQIIIYAGLIALLKG